MTNDNAKVHGIFRFYPIAVVKLFHGSFKGGGVNLKGMMPMHYDTKMELLTCLALRDCNWSLTYLGYSFPLVC